jgi:transposase
MDRFIEDNVLCYDIRSISSYSELNEYIRFGHNRDRETLPQLNLAMFFGPDEQNPLEAVRVYRDKDAVEKCFDDLKKVQDMKQLRMHSTEMVMAGCSYSSSPGSS